MIAGIFCLNYDSWDLSDCRDFFLLRYKGGLKGAAYAGEITACYNHGNLFNPINHSSDNYFV
jgi:hypothetical protein